MTITPADLTTLGKGTADEDARFGATKNIVTALDARLAAVEARPDMSASVTALSAALAAAVARIETLEGTAPPVTPPSPPVALPAGYKRLDEFGIDKGLTYDWGNPGFNIYLPNWEQGPLSMGDPALVTWNADGSATLDARDGPAYPNGRTWRSGSIQFNRPKLALGRAGAVVTVTDPSAVAAFFGYASNGKEVDFELVWEGGQALWAPAVHMPGSFDMIRKPKRAALVAGRNVLEYDLKADGCDFYHNGALFETIRPADMKVPASWDATTGMSQYYAVERHEGWAGWPIYSKAQMVVHGLKVELAGAVVTPPTPPAPPPPPTTKVSSVGANLDGAFDYSTARFAADALKMQRTGIPVSGVAAASDADGYLVRMPTGASRVAINIFTELPAALTSAAGKYRLRGRGKGTVELLGQTITATGGDFTRTLSYTPNGGSPQIVYTAIDPADPIRLLDLVHERDIASYDAGGLFSQHHLSTLAPLGVLRMMDLGATNGSPLVRWADRPKLSNRTWTSDKGVPLEVMIALCNAAKKPMWYCVPHLADDDYVTRAATLIRDTLDPVLPLYLELSNEGWNYHYAFSQTPYFEQQGIARWPGIDKQSARCQWIAGRTVQITRIVEQVFGTRYAARVRPILGGFLLNEWYGDQGLTGTNWQAWDKANGGDGLPPAKRMYGYAIAGYFGYPLNGNTSLKTILANQGMTAAVDEAIRILTRDVEELADWYAKHKAVADKHGVKLLMYEGGLHANQTEGAGSPYYDLLHRVHRDPRQAALHKRWLDIWRAAGGQELCIFASTGRPSQDGFWGFREHDDDLAAPRWVGVTEWATANPTWYPV